MVPEVGLGVGVMGVEGKAEGWEVEDCNQKKHERIN